MKFDAVYIWFADFHSLLPIIFSKLFSKKSFLVIGGYEVCRIKDLNYGALCSKIRGFFCIKSMLMCTINLAVSGHVIRKLKYLAPGSKTSLVHNCVDLSNNLDTLKVKEEIVLTVGIIDNKKSFYLKGIDTFIEVASKMPELKFIIIGLNISKLSMLTNELPVNIEIIDFVRHTDLPEYYSRAKFYCQFSRSESFGVSIAESMQYGCIPIVTNIGGMPETIGDTGYVVSRNIEEICKTIRSATSEVIHLQVAAKTRIMNKFSFEQRKERLIYTISKNLTNSN